MSYKIVGRGYASPIQPFKAFPICPDSVKLPPIGPSVTERPRRRRALAQNSGDPRNSTAGLLRHATGNGLNGDSPMNNAASRSRRQQRLKNDRSSPKTEAESEVTSAEILRPPSALPDPWLFDSQALLRELDRCREMVLLIPVNGDVNATHFAINNAVSAIWNLREHIRYLLHLHREGQREFAKKAPFATPMANPAVKTNRRNHPSLTSDLRVSIAVPSTAAEINRKVEF